MSSGGEVFLLLIALAICVFVALEFGKIAEMKGHSSGTYALWTFFLPPIGMLMVIALPDHANQRTVDSRANDALPPL